MSPLKSRRDVLLRSHALQGVDLTSIPGLVAISLPGVDLSGANLEGLDLSGADLSGANLAGA